MCNMDYKETLNVLVTMHNNIMNEFGYYRNAKALEKAISLLQFIIESNK